MRRARNYEKTVLRIFVEKHFTVGWADEIEAGYRHMEPSILVAVREKKVIGFAAYDCTRRGYFGPTGVDEAYRGKGVGKALLVAALEGLYQRGYAYGIIGFAGPIDFYVKTVNAIPIPNSEPGIFEDMLDQKTE